MNIHRVQRQVRSMIGTRFPWYALCAAGVLLIALVVIALLPSHEFEFVSSANAQQALAQESDEYEVTQEETVCVYICGEVVTPGVYEVAPNTRLGAVVEVAGGFTEDANETALNLARVVNDGEQIVVPPNGQESNAQGLSEQAGSASSGLVNINTASAQQLQALPGVGPSYAQRIVEYRTAHGAFTSLEQLKNVSGIGSKRFDSLKDLITL